MKRAIAIFACLGLAACAGVLGLTRKTPRAFPHREHVIAGVTCTQCHSSATQPTVPDDARCITCHKQPHDSHPCLGCHAAPDALAILADTRAHLNFEHARHVPATKGNCMRCHEGIAEGNEHLQPPMATCFRCHNHEAAHDARNCAACHKDLEDQKLLPQSHLAHDGDWLHEHGTRAASAGDACQACHRETFCADCHGKTTPTLPATLHFADPFAPSVHRAGFAARHAMEAHAEPGTCATCHSPDRCAGCHLQRGISGDGRRSPHPTGWVGPADNQHGREARRDPTACAACHDGAGQKLCVGCHKVGGVGGDPHPPGWTSRVPLASLPCRLCHPIGSRP